MKTRLIISFMFITLILLFSCSRKITSLKTDSIVFSQVSEIDKGLFKSVYLQKNNRVLATGRSDIGLVIYDPKSNELTLLNDSNGAGTKILLDQNEENIVFQTSYLVENRRYSSINIQNISDKKTSIVVENRRNLKLLAVNLNSVIYLDDNKIFSHDIITGKSEQNPNNISIAYSDHDLNLSLYINGEKKILNPLGPGNYIWVDISYDKKKILFNKIGSGTYVCNLSGDIINELGRINYAKWIDDGKWIMGMEDQDEGHRYIKSDIFLINTKSKEKINLTENTDVIALYPSVSKNLEYLIFNDENGKIYISGLDKNKIR